MKARFFVFRNNIGRVIGQILLRRELITNYLHISHIDTIRENDYDLIGIEPLGNPDVHVMDYSILKGKDINTIEALELFLESYDQDEKTIYYFKDDRLLKRQVSYFDFLVNYKSLDDKQYVVDEFLDEKIKKLPNPVVLDLRYNRLNKLLHLIISLEDEVDVLDYKAFVKGQLNRDYTEKETMYKRDFLKFIEEKEKAKEKALIVEKLKKQKEDLLRRADLIKEELNEGEEI